MHSIIRRMYFVSFATESNEKDALNLFLIFQLTADHALEFYRTRAKEELTCCRNAKHCKQYEVPFVELGFNVRRTVRTSGPKSLADFPQYFPTWIGVTTNKTPAGFNIFAPGQEKPQVILPPSKAVPWDSLEEGGSLNALLRFQLNDRYAASLLQREAPHGPASSPWSD